MALTRTLSSRLSERGKLTPALVKEAEVPKGRTGISPVKPSPPSEMSKPQVAITPDSLQPSKRLSKSESSEKTPIKSVASTSPEIDKRQGAVVSDVLQKPPVASRQGSTEATLKQIRIPLTDGTTVSADVLLEIPPRIWYWKEGTVRKQMGVLITTLLDSKDIQVATEKSGIPFSEVQRMAEKVAKERN